MKQPSKTPRHLSLRKLWPALYTGHKSGVASTLLAVIILAVFITASMAFFPLQSQILSDTQNIVIDTPTPEIPPTAALSDEIMRNREQTNGIVFGGVILVLIIVGGTLSVIGKKTPKR